jgi:hypothetical protein
VSSLDRLGSGVLVALAVIFALVTAVFALGLVWGLVKADPLLLVPQAVLALAFGTLDVRLWRLVRERRAHA